jgi:hypothetical protein
MASPDVLSPLDSDAGEARRAALEAFVRGDADWADLESAGLHVVERTEHGVSFEAAGLVPMVTPTLRALSAGMLANANDPAALRDWARVVLSVADLGSVARTDGGRPIVDAVWAAADGERVGDDVLERVRQAPA